jgi:uncharacterized protein
MTSVPAQPTAARQGLFFRYPLTCFFVMAYAFSWIVWSPWVLGQDGAGLLPIRIPPTLSGYLNAAVILFGPTLAALIMTAVIEGKARRTQTAQQARAVAGGHPMVPVRPSRRPWCRAA